MPGRRWRSSRRCCTRAIARAATASTGAAMRRSRRRCRMCATSRIRRSARAPAPTTIVSVVMAGKGQMPAFAQQPEPAEDAGAVGLRPPPGYGQRASGSRAVTTTASGGRARHRLLVLSGRERRRARPVEVEETPASSPAHPARPSHGERVVVRGPQPPQARERAGGRRGLRGGDRGIHQGVRAAGRPGGVVQSRRVLPPHRRRRKGRRRLPRVSRQGAEQPQPRGHRGEDRRARGSRAGATRQVRRGAAGPAEGGRRRRRRWPRRRPRWPRRRAPPPRRRRRRRPRPSRRSSPSPRSPSCARRPRRAKTPAPAGGSRPWVWVALSVLVVGAAAGGYLSVTPARRAAAGHRSGQLQAVSVRRARPPTPVLLAAVALLAACEQRWVDPAGRGGRRSDADAGSAVGGGDGGRNRPCALPRSAHADSDFSTHQLHCRAGSEYHGGRDDRDRCARWIWIRGGVWRDHADRTSRPGDRRSSR